MNGWLVDTNVVAALISSTGAPGVKAWAAARPEDQLFLSLVTIAEYDKGIHFLEEDDPHRGRHNLDVQAIRGFVLARLHAAKSSSGNAL